MSANFMLQQLGSHKVAKDIGFFHPDSEGCDIPIDSKCEFLEARKLGEQYAKQGKYQLLTERTRNYMDRLVEMEKYSIANQPMLASKHNSLISSTSRQTMETKRENRLSEQDFENTQILSTHTRHFYNPMTDCIEEEAIVRPHCTNSENSSIETNVSHDDLTETTTPRNSKTRNCPVNKNSKSSPISTTDARSFYNAMTDCTENEGIEHQHCTNSEERSTEMGAPQDPTETINLLNLKCENHSESERSKSAPVPTTDARYSPNALKEKNLIEYLYCTNSEKNSKEVNAPQHLIEPIVLQDSTELDIQQNSGESNKPQNLTKEISILQQFPEDAPPAWFKHYMDIMKKDIVKEVANEVTMAMSALLNRNLQVNSIAERLDHPNGVTDPSNSLRKSCNRHMFNSHSGEKKQYKKKKRVSDDSNSVNSQLERDEKQFSRYIKMVKERERKLQKKLDHKLERLEEKIHMILQKKKRYRDVAEMVNNLDKGVSKQKENCIEQNLSQKGVPPPAKVSENLNEGHAACTENEARLNCSITGHQILDKKHTNDRLFQNALDTDTTSVSSETSNNTDTQEEQSFEIINVPSASEADSLACNKLAGATHTENVQNTISPSKDSPVRLDFSFCTNANAGSSRDSPSFELVLKSPSPTLSMYVDDDHFSINCNEIQNVVNDEIAEQNFNDEHVKRFMDAVDRNEISCNEYILSDRETDIGVDLQKSTIDSYSFATKSLTTDLKEDARPPLRSEHSALKTDNPNDPNTDVKSSHTSYPSKCDSAHFAWSKVPLSQHSCESQTDLNDLTQSFHSHTTSITNVDVREPDVNGIDRFESMSANRQQNQTRGTGVSDKASSATSENPEACNNAANAKVNFSNQHSARCGNAGARKSSGESPDGTADAVHILPETLVTGTAHVASLAYATAKEVFHLIRTHTREDRARHRRNHP